MADPVVQPSDLALYLKDGTIDTDRAALLISDAQTACANFLGLTGDDDEFPANAAYIVARIAYEAYTTIVQARGKQLNAAGAGMGGGQAPWRGVRLTAQDEKDLERAANNGGGGAFSIDMLPVGAGTGLPWWDVSTSESAAADWDVPPS